MEKELCKRKASLPNVLAWQRKATRLMEQGLYGIGSHVAGSLWEKAKKSERNLKKLN